MFLGSSKGLATAHTPRLIGLGQLHSMTAARGSWRLFPWYQHLQNAGSPAGPGLHLHHIRFSPLSGLTSGTPALSNSDKASDALHGPIHAFKNSTTWVTLAIPSSPSSMRYNIGCLLNTAAVCWLWGNFPERLHFNHAGLLLLTTNSLAPADQHSLSQQNKGLTLVVLVSC